MSDGPDVMARWSIIVHGGAKTIAPELQARHRQGCLRAVEAGAAVLSAGGRATAAVEAAIRVFEDDPTFNAGRGSVLNAAGHVECDAALMDGSDLAVGGVAAVRNLRHPISVARAMLSERPVLLVAEGAEAFARTHDGEFCSPEDLIAPAADNLGCDTVGCVALDLLGSIAAGASTGGLRGCAVGRVGDTPLPGCGLYADDTLGGVSLSGDGESIIRTTLAARLMQLLEHSAPREAITRALDALGRVGGEAGLIVIDRHGQADWGHNSDHFAVARADDQSRPRAFLSRTEDEAHRELG